MRTPEEIRSAFASSEGLDAFSSFFLVGIGGAGMSSVGRMLHRRGMTVKGTDSTDSELIRTLKGEGIRIRIGHSGADMTSLDALVLSDAIDLSSSPEVKRARELGVPLFRRSQVLGWLLKDKKTIAITGTHGKTTTTSFLALALRAMGDDPTVVVGAEVPELGGAVHEGEGAYAIVEACEAYDSLHDFRPEIVVLNNLEADHLDFHGSWESLRDSVTRFVAKVPSTGALIYALEDSGAAEVASRFDGEKVGFRIRTAEELAEGPLNLHQKGRHNLANASAALTVVDWLGGVQPEAVRAIEDFRGARRRQERVYEGPIPGRGGRITVIDDYAHHPTEVESALQAIQEGWKTVEDGRRLVVVFQPHLYSRTEPLIEEFALALSIADLVVLTDIYPAREAPIPGVSSSRIAELVTKPCHYTPSRHLLPREVAAIVQDGDVVVGMGAGNIEFFAKNFVDELRRVEEGPRIAVAFGGDSTEREVSLHSGLAVHGALERLGYASVLLDMTDLLLGKGDISMLVGSGRPDLVVLTTHGGNGENGAIQGFLELMHIRYTGPDVRSSATAISKQATKDVFVSHGLPVPAGVRLERGDDLPTFLGPCVVKPDSHGSTVGLSFVDDATGLAAAVERAFEYDEAVLVEELVAGVEISVPVFGDRAMPSVEVVPKTGRYDFASKYLPGATEEISPAGIRPDQEELAREYALRAHLALGCRGITRTDMIVQDDRIVLLETNTVPGMTRTSLVPTSAAAAGMSFDDVVDWVVKDGLSQA